MRITHPGHYIFGFIILIGLLFPDSLKETVSATTSWFQGNFGWMVLLICAFFLGFCVYLAFSRYGSLRLGGEDEEPRFSNLSWFSMLFAAGIGVGLVFSGTAEPLSHYMKAHIATGAGEDHIGSVGHALTITYFHWGFHAWAIYICAALSIAYFSFRHQKPMLPSVPVTDNRTIGRMIDALAILGVVFGLVASLAVALLQLSDGLISHFGLNIDQQTTELLLLLLLFVCYMLSASTAIGKGIKILSDINIGIATLIMLFIIAVGPSVFILDNFVSAIGSYLNNIIDLSFNAHRFSGEGIWSDNMTVTLLMWWIAWAPFVGVFIARISRGRTLKEFILGGLFAPTLFSALWFATLGGTAIHLEAVEQPGFAELLVNSSEHLTYNMLQTLPLADITSIVMFLLLFIFLVTSADSGTYVLGMFTHSGDLNPPVRERLIWGITIAIVTAGAIISGGGAELFSTLAVFGGIPYIFIMVLQVTCLWRTLRKEKDI